MILLRLVEDTETERDRESFQTLGCCHESCRACNGAKCCLCCYFIPSKNLESQIISNIVSKLGEPRGKDDQITLGLYEKMFKSG